MGIDSPYRSVDQPDETDWRAANEFIDRSLQEFGLRVVEIVAHAHGMGFAFEMAKVAVKAVKWFEVAEGDGTVDLCLPIPLVDGVELEISAHPADGQGGPPLAVYLAPNDGSAVGVVRVGPVELDPQTEQEMFVDLVAWQRAAEQERPWLQTRLQEHATKRVLLYNLEVGRLLCVLLDNDGASSLPTWRIRTEVDPATGRLRKLDTRRTS